MNFTLRALTVLAALVPAAALAQGATQTSGYTPGEITVRAGWNDMKDAGSGLGVAADHRFGLLGEQWLLGVGWADGEQPGPEQGQEQRATNAAATTPGATRSISVWDVNWNWVRDWAPAGSKWTFTGGAGIGAYALDTPDSWTTRFGAQALAQAHWGSWLADARYVWTDKFANDFSIDGVRLSVGYVLPLR
jgi:hypothetical protein